MPMRLPAESLVLDPLDCLHLAGPLGAYLRDAARRDGGVPPRLALIAENVHVIAARYRSEVLAGTGIGTDRFRDEASGTPCVTSATWLTAEQAARMMRCSAGFVRRLCRERTLTGVKADGIGAWRVDEASVAEWLDVRRREAERDGRLRPARAQGPLRPVG